MKFDVLTRFCETCRIIYGVKDGSVELNARFHSYNPMGSLIPSQLQQSEEAGRKEAPPSPHKEEEASLQ